MFVGITLYIDSCMFEQKYGIRCCPEPRLRRSVRRSASLRQQVKYCSCHPHELCHMQTYFHTCTTPRTRGPSVRTSNRSCFEYYADITEADDAMLTLSRFWRRRRRDAICHIMESHMPAHAESTKHILTRGVHAKYAECSPEDNKPGWHVPSSVTNFH